MVLFKTFWHTYFCENTRSSLGIFLCLLNNPSIHLNSQKGQKSNVEDTVKGLHKKMEMESPVCKNFISSTRGSIILIFMLKKAYVQLSF